jgi:hypothetical protein
MGRDRVIDMTVMRWTLRALAGLAVVTAVTGVAAAQGANEAGPLDDAPDVQVLRSIMSGLGLKSGAEPGIEYRERSPLVVPPQMTLPPPDSQSMAQRNPNWPVDQDLRRAREYAAAKGRNPHYSEVEEGRVLRPSEIAPGPRGPSPTGVERSMTPEESARVLPPSALGTVGSLFDKLFDSGKPESKPFTREPPRTALTAPPPGYQTPSPAQPYGIGKQKYEPKAMDPMDQPARWGN